jgi:hypothetical protein
MTTSSPAKEAEFSSVTVDGEAYSQSAETYEKLAEKAEKKLHTVVLSGFGISMKVIKGRLRFTHFSRTPKPSG